MSDEQAASRWLQWAIGAFVAIGTAVQGFVIQQANELAKNVHKIDIRLTAIEASRFTQNDASTLRGEMLDLKFRVRQLEEPKH